MFCNKCGAEVDVSGKFCNKCGNKLEGYVQKTNEGPSIIFARESQFYGSLVPVKIFMDGMLVATISNGNQAIVPASIGMHKVAFDLWSGNGQYDVEIPKEHPNIKVTFKLGVGAVTSKPRIVSITYV